ncbi:MAG: glycosyltransferase, partial [Lachnospiraceae bacterium]|nr:glycosyltransferase [Lachnospiraceae bacterium]
MLSKPAVSLCIPTNGVIEWVFPVLDSIYKQNVDNDMFEVIVTDNGNNEKFSEEMEIYLKKYS